MNDQQLSQADWLTQTRLYPPRPRDDTIARPRLLTALDHALATHLLTLLSAPAGYGKTTLLSDFGFRISDWDGRVRIKSEIRNPKSQILPWPGSPWTRRTTTRPAS